MSCAHRPRGPRGLEQAWKSLLVLMSRRASVLMYFFFVFLLQINIYTYYTRYLRRVCLGFATVPGLDRDH